MFREYQFSPAAASWKLPFNLAVISHALILAAALILPGYIDKKPLITEFLTVDLVNIAAPLAPSVPEAVQPPAPPQKKQKVTIQKLKPVEARKVAPIAPVEPVELEIIPETPSPPVKAISIKPLKRKIKKKIPVPNRAKERDRKRQKQIQENLRQQLLQDARRQKALADAEAVAANNAVRALKQMLQADSAAASAKNVSKTSRVRPGGGSSSVIVSQYQASIESRLSQFWALPDIKTWNPDLSARVVINIGKNGQILSHNFEKRSGDRVFDQFVSRTIQEANPLPPIPGAMKVSQYAIGLHFTPGQIQ